VIDFILTWNSKLKPVKNDNGVLVSFQLSSLLDSMMSEVNDIKELAAGIEDLKKKLAEVTLNLQN